MCCFLFFFVCQEFGLIPVFYFIFQKREVSQLLLNFFFVIAWYQCYLARLGSRPTVCKYPLNFPVSHWLSSRNQIGLDKVILTLELYVLCNFAHALCRRSQISISFWKTNAALVSRLAISGVRIFNVSWSRGKLERTSKVILLWVFNQFCE